MTPEALIAQLEAELCEAVERRTEVEFALTSRNAMVCGLRNDLEKIKKIDGPGLDSSPGGPCYDIAKEALSTVLECGHQKQLSEQAALVEKMRECLDDIHYAFEGVWSLDRKKFEEWALPMIEKILSLPAPTALAQHDEEVRREALEEAADYAVYTLGASMEAGIKIRALAASRAGKGE